MVSSNDIIDLIKGFSLAERLLIVEEILRNIREADVKTRNGKNSTIDSTEPTILNLAGIMDEEEANVFEEAIVESRKIDNDEW